MILYVLSVSSLTLLVLPFSSLTLSVLPVSSLTLSVLSDTSSQDDPIGAANQQAESGSAAKE